MNFYSHKVLINTKVIPMGIHLPEIKILHQNMLFILLLLQSENDLTTHCVVRFPHGMIRI